MLHPNRLHPIVGTRLGLIGEQQITGRQRPVVVGPDRGQTTDGQVAVTVGANHQPTDATQNHYYVLNSTYHQKKLKNDKHDLTAKPQATLRQIRK